MGSNPATPTDESQGVTVKCSSFFLFSEWGGLPLVMSELLSRAKSTRKNGTLHERYMATIRMHFTIGGCGRYYQSGADTGISF